MKLNELFNFERDISGLTIQMSEQQYKKGLILTFKNLRNLIGKFEQLDCILSDEDEVLYNKAIGMLYYMKDKILMMEDDIVKLPYEKVKYFIPRFIKILSSLDGIYIKLYSIYIDPGIIKKENDTNE